MQLPLQGQVVTWRQAWLESKVWLWGEIGVSRIVTGPESDHWQCLSVTDSLTDGRLVNLIDVTLARVDDNSNQSCNCCCCG